MNWTDRAACKGQHKLFYPSDEDRARTRIVKAVRFCSQCPVLEDCREYATQHPNDFAEIPKMVLAGCFSEEYRRAWKLSNSKRKGRKDYRGLRFGQMVEYDPTVSALEHLWAANGAKTDRTAWLAEVADKINEHAAVESEPEPEQLEFFEYPEDYDYYAL